jgi:hypothetical protein
MGRLKRREDDNPPENGKNLPSCIEDKLVIDKYTIVRLLAEMGLFQHEIATCLNISNTRFSVQLGKDAKLREALELGKRKPDQQVQMSLYQTALGYNYQEVVVEEEYLISQKDGCRIETPIGKKVKTSNKHQPANPTAILFWLKNRLPKVWKDRVEATITLRDRAEMAHRFGA